MFIIFVFLIILVIVVIYIFLTWNFTYWKEKGVNGPKPLPLFGTFPGLILRNTHFADDINDIYKKYKNNESYVGVFLLRKPQLMLLEPQLIHDVFVTSFRHFNSNYISQLIDKNKDPLIAKNPFVLNSDEWHNQRIMVAPGFTTLRIRTMYSMMQSVSISWCEYLKGLIDGHSNNGLNGKDIALRFTTENIGSCVLGIKANAFTDQFVPIAENVKMFSENNITFTLYALIAGLFPNIVNIFKVKFIPRKCEDFFQRLIKKAISKRMGSSVTRHDFLDHLLSLKQVKNLNDHDLISHTMTFLIDGLDTSATVISHCLFLLGRHQAAQKKLHAEIKQNSINGYLDFEKLNGLSYLDACIKESIRILPPGLWAIKTCTVPYTFSNKRGKEISLTIGDSVMIPIYALHRDSKYYENPDNFKPERFLSDDVDRLKTFRNNGVYLGFGDGPRTCLGIRFANVQTKVAIASMVLKYKIVLNAKSKSFIKLDPKEFLAQQDGGVWIDLQSRS